MNKIFYSSSIICKICEDTVKGCVDEEDHSGSPMRSEWYDVIQNIQFFSPPYPITIVIPDVRTGDTFFLGRHGSW